MFGGGSLLQNSNFATVKITEISGMTPDLQKNFGGLFGRWDGSNTVLISNNNNTIQVETGGKVENVGGVVGSKVIDVNEEQLLKA